MKIPVAALQCRSESLKVAENLQRADDLLWQAKSAGAEIAVLPEMFNTGYGFIPDYGPVGETVDGQTLNHLRARAKHWKMAIAAGFVEREGRHLYDALAFVTPEGETHVYRKRNLVFWERFRFQPGSEPLVVQTKFGRIGFAICADMIYRKVWDHYRGRIDVAIVAAAWPEFADRVTGKKHWLLGHVGPLSGSIPSKAARDLGIPVIFANHCGETQTRVPLLHTTISDRFAGGSSVTDGRHGHSKLTEDAPGVVLAPITVHMHRGMKSWHSMSHSVPAA